MPSEMNGGPLNADLDTAAVEKRLAARAAAKRVELPPTFVDTPETRSERTKYYSNITFADQ